MTRTMTMTASQNDLLRAVVAAPDDDRPRLEYADWLAEHDRPERAEIIRIECERAELAAQTPGPQNPEVAARCDALKARSRELRWNFGRGWAAEVAPELSGGRAGPPPLFPRGFIEDVDLPAQTYLRYRARIHARTPVRRLSLTHPAGRPPVDLRPLTNPPGLGSVEDFSVAGPVAPVGLAALAAGPFARRLRRVRVESGTVTPGWLGWILSGPWADVLRDLELEVPSSAAPTGGGLGAAAARPAGRLEALVLRNMGVDPAEWTALAAGGLLPALRTLRLEYAAPGDGPGWVQRLAAAPMPAGLEDLSLVGNAIGPAGAGRLAGSGWLSRLRHLNLSDTELGDDGAAALAAAPAVAGLSTLSLASNQVTDRGARALAGSPHLAGVERLNLTDNAIGPAGAGLLRDRFGSRVSV